MKPATRLLIALMVIVALVAVAGYFLPSDVIVSRSIVVNAPRSEVFTVANTLRAFSRWSPWSERDPHMNFSFDGADSGVGQKMTWRSQNSAVGTGSMAIVDSLRDEKVVMRINFASMANAQSSLALDDAAGGATRVTWSFGYSVGGNPLAHYVALVMPSAVGKEYEDGLARLKKYVEAIPPVDFSDLAVEQVSVAPRTLVSVDATAADTAQGVSEALDRSIKSLNAAIRSAGLASDGPPNSVANGVKGNDVTMSVSYPVSDVSSDAKLPAGVHTTKAAAAVALRVHYSGDYAGLQADYIKLLAYALAHGWKVRGSTWNEYTGGIPAKPNAKIAVEIYLPVE